MSTPSIDDYTITGQSVTVIVNGEPITTTRTAANFEALRAACLSYGDAEEETAQDEAAQAICKALSIPTLVQSWANGEWAEGTWFEVQGERITWQGEPVDEAISRRILELVAENRNPRGFAQFWLRLCANPSPRSTAQLYPFLNHLGIPIVFVGDPRYDGCFLAYKGVTAEYKDVHTGTIDNRPGASPRMLRENISDDPNTACHQGFHVGALGYAKSFGQRVIICLVDPKDVVSIPYDHTHQKMRVEGYTVIGYWNGESLPSTYVTREDIPFLDFSNPGKEISSAVPSDYKGEPGDDWDDDEEEDDWDDDEEEDDWDEGVLKVEEDPNSFANSGESTLEPGEPEVGFYNLLDTLGYEDLVTYTTEHLRKYATYRVNIVGASKIHGGKNALVNLILETRPV